MENTDVQMSLSLDRQASMQSSQEPLIINTDHEYVRFDDLIDDEIEIDIQRKPSEWALDKLRIVAFEENTLWHLILPRNIANGILAFLNLKIQWFIAMIIIISYVMGIYMFFTCLGGNIAVLFVVCDTPITFIFIIIYLFTVNIDIGKDIIKDFTFWWKVFNILLIQILAGIWGYFNVEFGSLLTKNALNWFLIYGGMSVTSVLGTLIVCLIGAFKWNNKVRIIVPVLVGINNLHSAFYWICVDPSKTYISMTFRGDVRLIYIGLLLFYANVNVGIFFLNQAWIAYRYPNKTKLMRRGLEIIWLSNKLNYKAFVAGDHVLLNN